MLPCHVQGNPYRQMPVQTRKGEAHMEVVVKDTNSAKDDMAMNKLCSYLDKGIDDMQEGKLHVAEDAFQIIRNRMKNE